jgi:hypothetical protein
MMSDPGRKFVRLLCMAGLGWLAGEVVSRTVLARPVEQNHTSTAAAALAGDKPALNHGDEAHSEWEQFLNSRGLSSMSSATEPDQPEIAVKIPDPANGRILVEGTGNRLRLLRGILHLRLDEFPEQLKSLVSISDGRVRRQMVEAFFAAWAQHDPKAAIEAADRTPGVSMSGLNGALKTWAEKDPHGLMAWLRSSASSGWAKMQAQTTAFVYLTESDPLQAMQLAAESGKSEARRSVFINWYRRDPEAADAWMSTAPEQDRRLMFASWVQARGGNDPAGAWQLALTQAADRKQIPKVLPTVFAAWQEKDAPAARAALTKIPADVWEPSFASLAGSMLGRKEAPELDAMAASVPQTVQDSFWAGVASGSLEGDKSPEYAAAAFSHLPADDSDDRVSLADRITKRWLKIDPRAASEWVRGLSPGRTRDMAAAALAEGLILTDPDAASQWAADISNDRMRLDVQKRLSK